MKTTSRRYSLGLRLWHWLDALVILGLLLTYFLRTSVLDRSLGTALKNKLAGHQILIGDDVAKDLRRVAVDRLWEWHVNLGYALAVLLVWRLVLAFVDKDARVVSVAWRAWRDRGPGWRGLHDAGVKVFYVLFYAAQLVMVATGLSLVFSGSLGMSESLVDAVEELHEGLMKFFVIFVMAHVAGVFAAENTSEPGLASSMINGDLRKGGPRTDKKSPAPTP